jgi:hypothetical protein
VSHDVEFRPNAQAQIRQLTDDEIQDIGRAAVRANNATLASLVNEVLFQRSRSKGGTLEISTLVSMRTGEGRVQFEMGETRVQMSIVEARVHAVVVIEAAMAAQTDELLVRFLQEKVGLSREAALAALRDFRAMREEKS